MLGHRLKYGFISNYNETIFLQLALHGDGEPCIYYSDIIMDVDIINDANLSPSLRLAMFYFTYLACSPRDADWQLSKEVLQKTKRWVSKLPAAQQNLLTPFGDRGVAPADRMLPHLDLDTPRSSRRTPDVSDGLTTLPKLSALPEVHRPLHSNFLPSNLDDEDSDTEPSPLAKRVMFNSGILRGPRLPPAPARRLRSQTKLEKEA